MTEIELLMSAIRTETCKIDSAMRADMTSLKPQVDPLLYEVLDYGLFNGGKRIRPLLVVMSARLSGYKLDDVYELAKAFEYLHAATLFHDDVIDNAETRRGRPAVNKQFGIVAAILAGDFLHARSMEIVGKYAGSEGLRIFCEATSGMVDGEFMQLRNAASINLSEADYYDAIMGKTGLLIAASCEVGALFGRASTEQQLALRKYGVGIGCAFQMVDDLLDYLGDQNKTGKRVGNDLAEGKMTLPLISALSDADAEDRELLETILQDEHSREKELEKVINLIEKYKGFGQTRRRAEDAVGDACKQLQVFDFQSGADERKILCGLADYILKREK